MYLSEATRLRIEKLMKKKNLTGNKLALNSGMDRSNINKFLKGKNKSITLESIALICQSLNMPIKDFFDDKVFDDVDVDD